MKNKAAQDLSLHRWSKKTKEERLAHAMLMVAARKKKRMSHSTSLANKN